MLGPSREAGCGRNASQNRLTSLLREMLLEPRGCEGAMFFCLYFDHYFVAVREKLVRFFTMVMLVLFETRCLWAASDL